MADTLKYRQIAGLFTARLPDGSDADEYPDTVRLSGRVTFHPEYKKPLVFPGEHIVLEPIPALLVDGQLMVEVLQGDDVVLQDLWLPVTVDERANQSWSWRMVFDHVTLGQYGDEVSLPDRRFPVEEGDGPLDLSDVAGTWSGGTLITRGPRGYGITSVTAGGGQIVFEWEDGAEHSVPMPEAVQGVGVEDATQPAPGTVAFTLTDGSTTSQVALPPGQPGRDGANVLPTDTAVAQAVADADSASSAAVADVVARTPEPGANLARTLAKLRAGERVVLGAIGDSKTDPSTPGNAGGGPVERLAALLEARFGAEIVVVNRAVSGATMATQFLRGDVSAVVDAAPDVTVVHIGTNDTNSDDNSVYAPGYERSASLAAVERATAYIRDAREDAEFLFVGTGPYRSLSSPSNAKLRDYAAEFRGLAATVGAEWVDAYPAFIEYADEYGSIDALMYDSTHQNAAGNDLYADVMVAHFPLTSALKVTPALAPRARQGRYGIDRVDGSRGNLGYFTTAAPTTAPDWPLHFELSGTGWTESSGYDVSSTVGDRIILTADAVEFFYSIDISAQPVLDFVLDGATIASSVDLYSLSSKRTTTYWVAPFLGLTPGEHVGELVVRGGTLRVQQAAALLAAPAESGAFTPETRVIDLGAVGVAGVDATGAYTDHFTEMLRVPDGWGSMSVQLFGQIVYRTTGATTEPRAVHIRVEWAPGPFDYYMVIPADPANAKPWATASFAHFVPEATSAGLWLRSRVLSAQKSNVGTTAGGLTAIITRTS